MNILQPEITFLQKKPKINGTLSDELKSLLAIRKFNEVEKSNEKNPDKEITYRLAYGTDFLYLYIEVESDTFVCRDRAYQDGDGFHMVLSSPKENDSPADEFYVLGFSPETNSSKKFFRSFVWYRNIDLAFKYLYNTSFQFKKSNNKIEFELLLPWSEVYPYHPCLSDEIAFNLCYVSALKSNEKNYHYVIKDSKIQNEQSKRLYTKLRFANVKLQLKITWIFLF